ncbi:MAG: zinc ribbon domain-containing protein [Lachnospiraceae bacterium]|nr:zinc ribbon domain-containing protein [Lachnospiraceae bacterium]
MSKCHHCGVEIKDATETCPLCQGVLEIGGEAEWNYPDIFGQRKKLGICRRIVLFLALVAAVLCLYIDFHMKDKMHWSFIAAGGILLGTMVFYLMTDPVAGYRKRSIFTLFGSFAYILFIDIVTGFAGWSVNYVLPGAIFLINIALIGLMIYNRRNWQSYMVYQIGGIAIGAVPIALIYAGIVTVPVLSELAFGSSVFLFVGTLLVGGRAARLELQRRFYI